MVLLLEGVGDGGGTGDLGGVMTGSDEGPEGTGAGEEGEGAVTRTAGVL